MVMICSCRSITDKDLEAAFKAAKVRKASEGINSKISVVDTVPDLGEYNCGGCSRIFERAAQNYNETGELGVFKRSRALESGLCNVALNSKYSAVDLPDLKSSPIAANG